MIEPSLCLSGFDGVVFDWIEQAGGSNTRKQGKDAAAAAAKQGKKGQKAAAEEDGEDGKSCSPENT